MFLTKKLNYIKYVLCGLLICIMTFTIHSCLNANANTKKAEYSKLNIESDYASTNFLGSNAFQVPHDVDSPADSTQLALSVFAWKEFIALNWPSTYSKDGKRGIPDSNATTQDFLKSSNSGELVWHTYKHRVEMYPNNTSNYNTNFDTPPQYIYDENIKGLGKHSNTPLSKVPVFNNLDETSEINLCTLFVDGDPNEPGASNYNNPGIASGLPGAPRRMIYEAKGNRAMFDYVVKKQLYNYAKKDSMLIKTDSLIKNAGTGAVYLENPPAGQIVFPFGDVGGNEGSIEIKATWRQLTLKEYKTGRYLTAPIIRYRGGTPQTPDPNGQAYYEVIPPTPSATSLPYGLVGLHIIHKTKTFPSYVFATFEQVDNLSTEIEPLNKLYYYNRNENPFVSSGKQPIYTRSNAILADTDKVNNIVHSQIKKALPSSVWQYYKLIGVQGHPVQNDNNTDYYLANITTETNMVLANFSGTLDTLRGTKNPKGINVYQGNKKIVQGGCKGCHGNAQNADFSFITKDAPITDVDFINQPLLKSDQQ